MVALLLGCGQVGLGLDTSLTPEDSAPEVDRCEGQTLCIRSIAPDWGPTSGGTSVVIEGVGFGSAPELRFGNLALDVSVIGEDRLLVTSPESAAEGPVDVTVVVDGAEAVWEDGFTYASSDPNPDDTGDDTGGGGGDPTPSGLVEGAVELSYIAVACPACFGMSEQLNYSVAAAFHAPAKGSWYDDLPSKGSCSDTLGAPLASTYEARGDWAYLSTGATSLSLRKANQDGQIVYIAEGLAQSDYVKNAAWDLSVASEGWEVPDVLQTVQGFDDIQPIAIAYDDPKAFTAQIRANNATFTWSPTGVSESVVVQLDVYNPQGTAFLGTVLCHEDDDGSLTVPSSWLAFPSNSLLAIWVYRRQTSSALNKSTGHTIESAATIGLLGTGILR